MLNKLPYLSENPAYSKYSVGRYSYGKPTIQDWGHSNSKLVIGSFCSIGRGVEIFLGGEHKLKWATTFPLNHVYHYDTNRKTRGRFEQEHAKGDVIIGNDVWIGADTLILSGTTIGDGAVIGAKSLVKGKIESYTVNVGNPCIMKRKRFELWAIEKLIEMKWWNWPDEKIKEAIPLLMQENIMELFRFHERYENDKAN
jgi:acetyltransferase-like isoleucine patch superfamily enzyme